MNSAGARQLGFPNIAFVGRAGSGKTTAADLLVELGYQKLSFATPLKDIAALLWGLGARSDRDKINALGDAIFSIDERTLVKLLQCWIHEDALGTRPTKPIVVDDCRRENEWYALKADGFVIIRVTAAQSMRVDRLKGNGKLQDEAQLDHDLESAVEHLDPDYRLGNEWSTDDLYDSLVDILLKERKHR